MFVRAKKSGAYEYLQIVENHRLDGKVRQRVVSTLGRVDRLQADGKVDALLSSCASGRIRSLDSVSSLKRKVGQFSDAIKRMPCRGDRVAEMGR